MDDQEAAVPWVVENLRLRELVAIVRENEGFYTEFVRFLDDRGYEGIQAFVQETEDARAVAILDDYLASQPTAKLHNGLGRPYPDSTAKWYFLAWILRDAPAQRLAPLLRGVQGASLDQKKAFLLNELRKFVGPLFPEADKWEWPVLSEIMLARLEGSRRALKGAHLEEMVRGILRSLFAQHHLPLQVGDKEVRIADETYDVQVAHGSHTILLPVKTRETMGRGHANLFTRDIFKSISVAQERGYECIPVLIAESWAGDLASLRCRHCVHIQANPNQTERVGVELATALAELLPVWEAFAQSEP